ncbi:MAG: sialidase family protein [Mariniblastus sp.]|nr:sialidase family protein [Mariniblastus sp.]
MRKRLLVALSMSCFFANCDFNFANARDHETVVSQERIRRDYSISTVDLNNQTDLHIVVAKDLDRTNQYLGHPTTVLLDDGQTIIAAFPTGHGRGKLRFCRSNNGGKAWQTMKAPDIDLHEVPTLFKTETPDGRSRIVLTTCVPKTGDFRWMVSDDGGGSWSKLQSEDLGLKRGIIVALSSMWQLRDSENRPINQWRGVFHDFAFDNFTIDLSFAKDPNAYGGWNTVWSKAKKITFASANGLENSKNAQLCEAGFVRSPEGNEIALLFRPQAKKTNAMISFSSNEGETWDDPKELPGSLTGERHVARYGPDGWLLVCFRDYSPLNKNNPHHADWVGWVGRWQDLKRGSEGQYRIRLKDNYGNSTNNNVGDCGYTAIELIEDVFVCTSYGHWELASGQQAPNGKGRPPFVIATRFKLADLDRLLKQSKTQNE